MKKIILTFVTVFSLFACKKQETTTSENADSSMITADSASAIIGDSISKPFNNQIDSTAKATKDTAVVKIEILKEEKKLLTEKVAKAMDSSTRSSIISEIKVTQQKIDSVKTKMVSTRKKQKVSPQIIREKKVIYRETPKERVVESTPKITKKGSLEILVEDLELAQLTTKEQISKYDGKIKSEQISSDGNKEITYLQISVPLDKSDYLIKDLENNVGKITYRNIEITGEQYSKNSVCNLEITLQNNSENASIATTPKSFGGRTLGAVGTGWKVIEEIFLFLLPFWPLILIGGGVYYFLKRKKINEAN